MHVTVIRSCPVPKIRKLSDVYDNAGVASTYTLQTIQVKYAQPQVVRGIESSILLSAPKDG